MGINWLKSDSTIRKIKGIGIILLPIALYLIPFNWVDNDHTICIYKNITGADCYGCGITRAIFSALHFKFIEACNYNKLILIVMPLIMYLWLKLVNKYWKWIF